MEPAGGDLNSLGAELLGDRHRPRELVRLHPDEADEPAIRRLDTARDLFYRDDRVALVVGVDFDRDIGAEHLVGGRVLSDGVKAGQRV